MKSIWHIHAGALLCCVFLAAPALAKTSGKPDVAAGKVKFDTCEGCHGIPGYQNEYPEFNVPKLGGQHAAYIVAALEDYRSGKRKSSVMHAQASSLSDQDIQDIAAYLQQQKAR